jgi:hypothetical protein|tara:strand:- start:213 stop:437 length:225 start_codon:yes stop_codon:yes gene_type:complete
MSAKKNKPGLDKFQLASIRIATMAIEEQLEVLSEGMSNEYNAEGYLDQQGIDAAISCRKLALQGLNQLTEGESE